MEGHLRSLIPSVERSGDSLRWAAGDGISELSLTHVQQLTFDGLTVAEMVTLTHRSPYLADFSPGLIAHLNSWATISSLVPADGNSPARFVSKVGIFSTDREAAERNYAPLIALEAVIIGWHAAHMARGLFSGDPEHSGLERTNQKPPFDNADFEAAKTITDRHGFFGSLSDLHFSVEFPWDAGAITNLLGDMEVRRYLQGSLDISQEELDRIAGKTTLLQIRVAEHPLYGKGIQSTLELPFLNDPATSQMVNELNAWELSAADLPPHFGAWCVGNRAATYASFLPTQYCVNGLLQNLTTWMRVRHVRVRQWLHAWPTRQ
jgi:hypothetical protein